jgi:hypothetical protein
MKSKNSNQFGYTINNTDMANGVKTRIISLVDREGAWTGTMTQLRTAIGYGRSKSLTNPSMVRRVVNTIASSLRRQGVSVKFGRTTDHMRTRFVSFSQI